MHPEQPSEQEQTDIISGCANCGSSFVEPDRPTKLCTDCRNNFIRYPIPLWIKGFGIGIGLVVVFSLFSLPKQLSLGVHLERGKKAIAERKFVTAERELKAFTQKVPDSKEALANLLIASFHNLHSDVLSETLDKLQGEEIDDAALLERANDVIAKLEKYVPGDSANALISRYNNADLVPDTAYFNVLRQQDDDLWTAAKLSSDLFDDGKYKLCDSILQRVIKKDEAYWPALRLLSSLKRQQDSMERSLHYCNVMLGINHEDTYAMASKARTLLRQKKDKEAMNLIHQAIALDGKDGYTQATLALAYHVNNKIKERDQLMSELRKDLLSSVYLEYVTDVIQGKEKFR
ncbi:MAG: hypothetical protein WCF67_13890 [Chitinophagaceae bacterium]